MDPRDPAAIGLLRCGHLQVTGRLVDASNATLVATVEADGLSAECVYKPIRGERPLWDFPDGTLADREVATFLLSEAIGWSLVPPTVMREGPFGRGMVQLWVESPEESELIDIVAPAEVPPGWRTVLRARGRGGEAAVLVHADRPELKRMAAFDIVVNNADRKGGHVLLAPDGGIYGVDHGVCLHEEEKLRTVLWGWVGERISEELLEPLRRLRRALDGGLWGELREHLTPAELAALTGRVDSLLTDPCFPAPSGYWPAIPWPAF